MKQKRLNLFKHAISMSAFTCKPAQGWKWKKTPLSDTHTRTHTQTILQGVGTTQPLYICDKDTEGLSLSLCPSIHKHNSTVANQSAPCRSLCHWLYVFIRIPPLCECAWRSAFMPLSYTYTLCPFLSPLSTVCWFSCHVQCQCISLTEILVPQSGISDVVAF